MLSLRDQRVNQKLGFLLFFYDTSHLYHVRLIDGVASIIIFLLHGDARSCNFLMSGSIFFPTTLYQEGEKPFEYGDFLRIPPAGIEPGPPAKALSITLLPLSNQKLVTFAAAMSVLWLSENPLNATMTS